MSFLYYKISHSAFRPVKINDNSVGYNLKSPKTVTLSPGEIIKLDLDLQMMFPDSCYGRISSMTNALMKGLIVQGKCKMYN
jgi:dUTPase